VKVETNAEQLFFTTLRIETDGPDGRGCGTGFLFHRLSPSNPDTGTSFVVTNKHVISGSETGTFWFTKKDDKGEPIVGQKWDVWITGFERRWYGHPSPEVDVAVLAVNLIVKRLREMGREPFFKAIPSSFIPTADELRELDAIESITFIGYPNGMYDNVKLMPLARQGMTASPPELDYEGCPVFLIDASVFPGSSGSPVFIMNQGTYLTKGNIIVGNRLLFMGLVASVFTADQHGEVEIVPIPTRVEFRTKAKQMIDIGVVYKAHTILETIDHAMTSKGIGSSK
jgi:hypothetical protein